MQFRETNHKNDVLATHSVVTAKEITGGECRVYLDMNVVNQNGGATAPGKAVVVLPSCSAVRAGGSWTCVIEFGIRCRGAVTSLGLTHVIVLGEAAR